MRCFIFLNSCHPNASRWISIKEIMLTCIYLICFVDDPVQQIQNPEGGSLYGTNVNTNNIFVWPHTTAFGIKKVNYSYFWEAESSCITNQKECTSWSSFKNIHNRKYESRAMFFIEIFHKNFRLKHFSLCVWSKRPVRSQLLTGPQQAGFGEDECVCRPSESRVCES